MRILESEKDALIETIEAECLHHNFGTFNKVDFDLLIFHHYMESLRKNNASLTNYEIAKQLGITVQRVVGLKDKEASRYPYDESAWKKQFLDCCKTAYVSGDKIVINITDRRLYRELESYLEKLGLGTEYDLNPSIFKAEPERFIEAIKKLYPEREQEIEELESKAKRSNPVEEGIDKSEKRKIICKYVVDFASSVLSSVVSSAIVGNF